MINFDIRENEHISYINEYVKKIKRNYKGNIKDFARKENIIIAYIPIDSRSTNPYFSSLYLNLKEDDLSFIGINSSDYYDNQLYAIARELYYYYEKEDIMHFSRISSEYEEINEDEIRANMFAAELLLPEDDLKFDIEKEKKKQLYLDEFSKAKLLRVIAKLQCKYKLPYKHIIRKLVEIKAISDDKFKYLYSINPRNKNSIYYKIGLSIDKDVFEKLNQISNQYGVDGCDLEDIIENYEEGYIKVDEFIEDLFKLNKTINDLGYENKY